MTNKIIGIMGAMPQEISEVADLLSDRKEIVHGMRTYYTGTLNGIDTVVVFSRWGKVAAATTVSSLILEFKITDLIFIGVAGAIADELKIGDIVIAQKLIQHDMDARPLMNRYEIPLLGITYFETDSRHLAIAEKAINTLLTEKHLHLVIGDEALIKFGIEKPRLFIGDIASGDKFFSSQQDKNELKQLLPEIVCVEMEGAAVAQVCYEYNIPFIVIRTISDESNENSVIDFPSFINAIASKYSVGIVKGIFQERQTLWQNH
ncbi:MAG TPA: 5'-methylthioadenosine/adenosylhomocysteine nucleosidase [Chitinophagaceae bacterium]